MSTDAIETGLARLRAGATLVLWRMSSPWNWYLHSPEGQQYPVTAQTAQELLKHCQKLSDSPGRVPDYHLAGRRGRDVGLPEKTQYGLRSES